MITLKTLIGPQTRHACSLDESTCVSWIVFGTRGFELPAGASTADLAPLVLGGVIDAAALPTVSAACELWSGRRGERLELHATFGWSDVQCSADVRAMLDRQQVIYEDRRSRKVVSAAYRRGRAVGERTERGHFIDKKRARVELSALGDVAAMTSTLAILRQLLDECRTSKTSLRIETTASSGTRTA
jgi:hypothetical protein